MGTVRKIGEDYYIEFHARGLLYQQKAGKDKKGAEKLLHDVEEKIRQGEMGIIVRDVETDIFFQTFRGYARTAYSPQTFIRYEAVVSHFTAFCGQKLSRHKKLSEVTPSIIEQYRVYLIEQTVRPKVINLTLVLLKDVLEYAIKLGYLNDNPALHTRLADVPDTIPPKTVSREEIDRVLEKTSEPFRTIIELILRTGMRAREVAGLTWSGIDFPNKSITIEHTFGRRRVPMDAHIEMILKGLQGAKARGEENVFDVKESRLREALAKSGCTVQVLQNTFARSMLKRGVSLVGLSKLLGLRDVVRVMRYSGFVKEPAF